MVLSSRVCRRSTWPAFMESWVLFSSWWSPGNSGSTAVIPKVAGPSTWSCPTKASPEPAPVSDTCWSTTLTLTRKKASQAAVFSILGYFRKMKLLTLSCCVYNIQITKEKLFKRDNDCNDDNYDGDDDKAEVFWGGGFQTSTTDLGQTPLHLAASEGFLDCAEILVKAGADVLAKDNLGQTPLDLACIWCHRKVAR